MGHKVRFNSNPDEVVELSTKDYEAVVKQGKSLGVDLIVDEGDSAPKKRRTRKSAAAKQAVAEKKETSE